MRIFVVENDKRELEEMKEFFKKYSSINAGNVYEVVQNENDYYPCASGKKYYSREESRNRIIKDIREDIDKFDVLLMDLYLIKDESNIEFDCEKDELLSIEIIKVLEKELNERGKKFFFITAKFQESHPDYMGKKNEWLVLGKPIDNPEGLFLDCPIPNIRSRLGCEFIKKGKRCSIKSCFLTIIDNEGV